MMITRRTKKKIELDVWGLLLHIQKTMTFDLSMCSEFTKNLSQHTYLILKLGSSRLELGSMVCVLLGSTISVAMHHTSREMNPTIVKKFPAFSGA